MSQIIQMCQSAGTLHSGTHRKQREPVFCHILLANMDWTITTIFTILKSLSKVTYVVFANTTELKGYKKHKRARKQLTQTLMKTM